MPGCVRVGGGGGDIINIQTNKLLFTHKEVKKIALSKRGQSFSFNSGFLTSIVNTHNLLIRLQIGSITI